MSVNAVQFGNLYAVKAIKQAQTQPAQINYSTSAIKERELHPRVSSDLAETPTANKLDLLC